MVITISYNHKDIDQARRLLKWMGFLSGKNGDNLKRETVVLSPSALVAGRKEQQQMAQSAEAIFGQVLVYVPPWYEKGWPDSCNHMFKCNLEYVEREGLGDMFWIEPDCVPLTADWLTRIQAEWKLAKATGKRFMGFMVPRPYPHMNGNGIYGEHWREVAPSLIHTPTSKTWDMHAAPEILPFFHASSLFSHVWHPRKRVAMTPSPGSVIYHQDKTGLLMKQIDAHIFGGECYSGKDDIIEPTQTMTKFFKSLNASLVRKAAGIEIRFDPCMQVADHWTGVFKAETEGEQAALADLMQKVKSISEITEAEYTALLQKKTRTESLMPFDPMRFSRIPGESVKSAVVNPPAPAPPLKMADVVKTAKVVPAQPELELKRGKSAKN